MFMTSRKSLLIVVSLLCLALVSLAVYGVFWIKSNIAHVNVAYAVVLSTSVSNNVVTLNATVTNDRIRVGAGINVDFYYSINGGYWNYFASNLTDASGVAQTTYIVTSNGGYDFQAEVTVP